ncbi:cytochrome P450 (plasmid) [Embleya sp. NBC_00888]|uniref:cytochrome P450 n=1 Tax=Embleya sp. NBC_00888 TaxID=2975960 RepID=UPI002F9125AE|nr:cytochrome P450 [Embleya sp. NBC_00888]
MTIRPDTSTAHVDLVSASFRNDPYPALRALREHDPVHFDPRWNAWLVTRYDDVVHGIAHPAISADRITPRLRQFPPAHRERFRPLAELLSRWPLMADPPEHRPLRAPVTRSMNQRVIRSFQPLVERTVTEILDRTLARGELDAVADLAVPLPLYVVSEIIGAPRESHELLKRCAIGIVDFFGAAPATYLSTAAEAFDSVREASAHLGELVARRRRAPNHDLISVLLRDGSSSDEQVVSTCLMMVFAGFETTTNLLGNGLLLLLRHPGQLARLRESPDLLPSAIEEMLRLESPVQRLSRMARRDLVLGGREIREGDLVFFMLGAANRDPSVFVDPDRFDIAREGRRHQAFGPGVHACPGAALARMEACIAFGELLRRAPVMSLGDDDIRWHDNLSVRALRELRVRLD